MKYAIAALIAATTFTASAQDAKKEETKKDCVPPPKELVVKEIAAGKGEKVVAQKAGIYAAYTGWFYDGCKPDFKGEMFDTSQGRQTPFGYMAGVGRVIKGWDEGLMGAKEGTKRLLIVPPDKAYGEKGAGGGKIPPNSTLVFEVEVVGIPFPAPAPGAAQGNTGAPAQPKN